MKSFLPAGVAVVLLGACALTLPTLAGAADAPAAAGEVVYVAHLHPLNTSVTGLQTGGEARFVVGHDKLDIRIDAKQLPPGIMHLQHFHGFADNHRATCPTPAADTNGDGIIDLHETEASAGTTMVPFHADPAGMQILNDTYPKATAKGTFEYRKTVPLADMSAAFGKAFGGAALDLDRRVVFVHGVLPATKLASSVASLGDVPAQVTLPIACGEIVRLSR